MSRTYFVQIDARFLSRTQHVPFLTHYVTATGVFVRTDAPPEPMALLRIEFTLPPKAEKVVLHGMVTQISPAGVKGTTPGAEISFFAKDGEAATLWDEFIAYVGAHFRESRTEPVVLAHTARDQVRRAHPRVVPIAPIRAVPADGDRALDVGDISAGGMFIRTDDAFIVGDELHVTLEDPESHARFSIECIVRRRVHGTNGGIGVAFLNVDDEHRVFLSRLMQSATAAGDVPAECRELAAPESGARIKVGRGVVAGVETPWAPPRDGWGRSLPRARR